MEMETEPDNPCLTPSEPTCELEKFGKTSDKTLTKTLISGLKKFGETSNETPTFARKVSFVNDFSEFQYNPVKEQLVYSIVKPPKAICAYCSTDCFTLTTCCGFCICPDCVDTELLTHCVNCGDALPAVMDTRDGTTTRNALFGGTEKRHLQIDGNLSFFPNYAFIDKFGVSCYVHAIDKDVLLGNEWIQVNLLTPDDENRVYFGFRAKCPTCADITKETLLFIEAMETFDEETFDKALRTQTS